MSEEIEPKPEGDDNDSDTQVEFGELFRDVDVECERMKKLAKAAKDEGKGDLAAAYGEMGGTILQLVKDLIGSCGGAFDSMEQRLDALDPAESSLTEEDGEKYLAVFDQIVMLLDQLEKNLPESAAEQKEVFQALRRLVEDRIEFTKEIMVEDDDDDDDPNEPGEPPN